MPIAPSVYPVYRGFYLGLQADAQSADTYEATYYSSKSIDGLAWTSWAEVGTSVDSPTFFIRHDSLDESSYYRYCYKLKYAQRIDSNLSDPALAGLPSLVPSSHLNLDASSPSSAAPVMLDTNSSIQGSSYVTNVSTPASGFSFTSNLTPPAIISTLTLTGDSGGYIYGGTATSSASALANGLLATPYTSTFSTKTVTLQGGVDSAFYKAFQGYTTGYGVTFYGNTSIPAAPVNIGTNTWNATQLGTPTFDYLATPIDFDNNAGYYSPVLAVTSVTPRAFTGVTRRTNGVAENNTLGSSLYQKFTTSTFVPTSAQTSTDFATLATPTITGTSTTTTGGSLPANTTYYYWVTAVTLLGESSISGVASRTTGAGTTNKITITFTGVDYAYEYWVYRSTSSTIPTSGNNYLNKGNATAIPNASDTAGTVWTYANTGATPGTNPKALGYPSLVLALTEPSLQELPNAGTIRLDGNEQVSYTGKTIYSSYAAGASNPYYEALTGVTRGINGTTAQTTQQVNIDLQAPIGTLQDSGLTLGQNLDAASASSSVVFVDGDTTLTPTSGTMKVGNEEFAYTGIRLGSLNITSLGPSPYATTAGIGDYIEIPDAINWGQTFTSDVSETAAVRPCEGKNSSGTVVTFSNSVPESVTTDMMIGNIDWNQSAQSLQGGFVAGTDFTGTGHILGVSTGPLVPPGRTLVSYGNTPLLAGAGEQPIWVSLAVKDTSITSGVTSSTSSLLDSDVLATGFSTKASQPGINKLTSKWDNPFQPITLQPTVMWFNNTSDPVQTRFEFFYFTLGYQYAIPPKNGFGASVSYTIF